MRKSVWAILVVLLAAVAAGFFAWQHRQKAGHAVLSGPPPGGDFTLQSANGPVSLHDFKGKIVLLYFGYTFCPDICPTNLGNLSVAWRNLPPEIRDKTQIIFVSIDPERDTPDRLKAYTDFFNAHIIGLTGDPKTLEAIAHRYGAVYKKVPVKEAAIGYLVDHSAFTYLIDPDGKLVTQLPHGTSPKAFQQAITDLYYKTLKGATP